MLAHLEVRGGPEVVNLRKIDSMRITGAALQQTLVKFGTAQKNVMANSKAHWGKVARAPGSMAGPEI